MDNDRVSMDRKSFSVQESDVKAPSNGQVFLAIDQEAEKALVRKLDCYLLPYLSLMYFFNAVDRVSTELSRIFPAHHL